MFSKLKVLFSEHTVAAVVGLIGVVITAICTLVGAILTGYFVIRAGVAPVELSIRATQTAEARLTPGTSPDPQTRLPPTPTAKVLPTDLSRPIETSTAHHTPTAAPSSPTPRPASANRLALLTGIWQVSRQNQYGSSLEYWDIKAGDNQIIIEAFRQAVPGVPLPGDYRKNLPVSDFEFDGQRLAFTLTGSVEGVVEKFHLVLRGTDRIEGSYTSTDTFLRDTGFIQGEAGIIEVPGQAILIKQSE